MRIIRKDEIKQPIENSDGELFYEMIGRGEKLGNSEKHSFGIVKVLDGFTTRPHYHPNSEETYYITKGNALMIIDDKSYPVKEEDTILILPNEKHQLLANNGNVEAIVVCSPAWEINNTIFVEEDEE